MLYGEGGGSADDDKKTGLRGGAALLLITGKRIHKIRSTLQPLNVYLIYYFTVLTNRSG